MVPHLAIEGLVAIEWRFGSPRSFPDAAPTTATAAASLGYLHDDERGRCIDYYEALPDICVAS
jgi:hypothetical protein